MPPMCRCVVVVQVGLWVSLGYICQAIGLETTKASNSAFICRSTHQAQSQEHTSMEKMPPLRHPLSFACSLSVVVVPVINGLLYKRRIPATTWAACLMAITGVGLLTLQGELQHAPI